MAERSTESISLIQTPYDLEGRELVCYPYLITTLKISMPRPFLKPRIVFTVVTTDLVKGIAARANMFPEADKIQIQKSALVPPVISYEQAVSKARKLALKWIMYKFHVFRTPAIEIVQEQESYKAFFFIETENKKALVDSVKGLDRDDI